MLLPLTMITPNFSSPSGLFPSFEFSSSPVSSQLSFLFRDLAANWDVNLASELEDYISEIEKITYSFDGLHNLNFAEGRRLKKKEKNNSNGQFIIFLLSLFLSHPRSRAPHSGLRLRLQSQGGVPLQPRLPDP